MIIDYENMSHDELRDTLIKAKEVLRCLAPDIPDSRVCSAYVAVSEVISILDSMQVLQSGRSASL